MRILLLLCFLCIQANGAASRANHRIVVRDLTAEPPLLNDLEYRQRVWTTDHGLPHNTVLSVIQARDGYLWIGTVGGLARFDGQRFLIFNSQNSPLPATNDRMELAEDHRKNLWIGTEAGLFRLHDGQFQHYTTGDGLWDNDVSLPYVGSDGTVWILNGSGLNKFEASKLTRLETLEEAHAGGMRLQFVFEDTEKYLWIARNQSIQRRDIRTWSVESTLDFDQPIYARCIDQQGRVWLAAGTNLISANGEGWTQYVVGDDVFNEMVGFLTIDRKDNLWFGRGIKGLGRIRNEKISFYDRRHGLPSNWIRCLSEDRNGNLWLGTDAGGLVCLQYKGIVSYGEEHGLSHNSIRAVYPGRDGGLWIGTDGGLSKIGQPIVDALTRKDSVPIGSGREREKTASVVRSLKGQFPIQSGLSESSPSPRFDRGEGRGEELSTEFLRKSLGPGGADPSNTEGRPGEHFSGNAFCRNFTEADGLTTSIIRALHEDRQGGLWIGTEIGLDHFAQGRFQEFDVPGKSFDRAVRAIMQDHSGALWFGSKMGLHNMENGRLTTYSTEDGLSADEPRALLEDKIGDLWVGTFHGGLNRITWLDPLKPATEPIGGSFSADPRVHSPPLLRNVRGPTENQSSSADPKPHSPNMTKLPPGIKRPCRVKIFTTSDSLCDNHVSALFEDPAGILWIGTRRGLNRMKDDHLVKLVENAGLPDSFVYSIVQDDLDRFWISSDRGVYCVNRQDLNDLADGKVSSAQSVLYDENDGMRTRVGNGARSQPAACKTADGKIWIATTNSLARIDPRQFPEGQTPPPIMIEQVRANGQIVFGDGFSSGASSFENRSSKLVLPPGGARILQIQYTAAVFTAAEKAQFKYRMEGFDQDWINAGTRREVSYTNLKPGSYRFRVFARNHHGIWNQTGAALALTLAPHVWETLWFRCGAGLLTMSLVLGTVRWRELRVKKHSAEREHEHIKNRLHDEASADLTNTLLLLAQAKHQPPNSNELAGNLAKIEAKLRDLGDALDLTTWSADPNQDSLRGLLTYIGQYAEDLLRAAGIRFRIEMPDPVPVLALTVEQRHHLFLVFKEALHNVVKHSGATAVSLRCSVSRQDFALVIEDNGCGMNEEQASAGHGIGLASMRKRMKILGGRFTLQSKPGEGTRIEVELSES